MTFGTKNTSLTSLYTYVVAVGMYAHVLYMYSKVGNLPVIFTQLQMLSTISYNKSLCIMTEQNP